ncbi:MAG: S8 family serine peptidase [Theionarchaea archaeon]|nr:S8 family serine peptidase [Theionarchaea archaeon]
MKKELSLVLVGILALAFYTPLAAPGGETVSLIFEGDDQEALMDAIQYAGGIITVIYESVPMVAAEVPLSTLGSLLMNPHVLEVYKDEMMYLPYPPEFPEGDPDNFPNMEIMDVSSSAMEPYTLEDIGNLPQDYYNYMVTGAEDIWYETEAGDGTLVAVIDTGTFPGHPCFLRPDGTSRVIGGISFAPGEDPDSWGDPDNHYHGTVCGGIIASNCAVLLPETHLWAQAIMNYAPAESWFTDPAYPGYIIVPLLGMAPLAELYAIKVFPKDGSGVPSSIIMQGLDYAIQQRKLYNATGGAEGLPIDVISMSLGGGTGFDGHDPEDRLVDEATLTGIVVSTAAGNSGPAYNTVSTPGCAFTSIAVGAASDPVHTRVGFDIVYDFPGIGGELYPYDETQIIYFSSRGPTTDGRRKPDVLACGVYVMSAFPPYSIGIMSGTSASCPVVSGAAALLVNWQRMNRGIVKPSEIRNAILKGAVPLPNYEKYDQGEGYLNLPNALQSLKDGVPWWPDLGYGPRLRGENLKGGTKTWSSGSLGPGETFDVVIKVDKDTASLDICLSNVSIPGPENPYLGDSIEFYIQSAIRTTDDYLYDSINIYEDACFTLEEPMPGNVRIVVEGDWTNWGTASCNITVTEHEGRILCPIVAAGIISNGEWKEHYVEVPEGTAAVTFELWWFNDWSRYPTHDLDMYVIAPDGTTYLGGAVYNSPEKQVIIDPVPGTYTVLVFGYEMYLIPNPYWLRVCLVV